MTDRKNINRTKLLKKQAEQGDEVCQAYLNEQALNAKSAGGEAFIETLLDMQDEDDDFRPY